MKIPRDIRIHTYAYAGNANAAKVVECMQGSPASNKQVDTYDTLRLYCTQTEHFYLDEDSVYVSGDGWYDEVFMADSNLSSDFYFYVNNPLFYTNTLFDITNSTVYDTSHVGLMRFNPEDYNKETCFWMAQFLSNIPVKKS